MEVSGRCLKIRDKVKRKFFNGDIFLNANKEIEENNRMRKPRSL